LLVCCALVLVVTIVGRVDYRVVWVAVGLGGLIASALDRHLGMAVLVMLAGGLLLEVLFDAAFGEPVPPRKATLSDLLDKDDERAAETLLG
jgi:hypothetical protein